MSLSPPTSHLLLIGLRGSGKSTLGRYAADIRCQPFTDLDERTEAIGGFSAAECFTQFGESRWREWELQALTSALQEEPSVIALGGGTPLAAGAEEIIQDARNSEQAIVAWLDARNEELLKRTDKDMHRPPLTDRSPLEEIIHIRKVRTPVFARIADHVLDTGTGKTDELVGTLAEL